MSLSSTFFLSLFIKLSLSLPPKVLDERTDQVTVVPESHPDYLALLGTSGLTAAIGLCEAAHIRPGETVLISAAAGGLGHIAAQWARLAGCRVIALTSSKRKEDYLNTLQLERVINYREEDLSSVLSVEYPVSHRVCLHQARCSRCVTAHFCLYIFCSICSCSSFFPLLFLFSPFVFRMASM